MSKILLADDDFSIGMEIEEMLTALGYDFVGQAGSGRQAVQMARDLRPDMVLMDIVMPGEMNGVEAAEKIKAELGLPIVFVSGYGDVEYIEAVKQIEPFGYIMKPFYEEEIRAAVEIAFYKRKMELKLKEANDRVKQHQEMLTVVIHKSPVPIAVAGLDGSILSFNEALVSLTGYRQEEVKDFEDLAAKLNPDEKDGTLLWEKIGWVPVEETKDAYALMIRGKDGAIKNVDFHAARFEDGVIIQMVDVTARKRAEQALKTSERQMAQIIDFLPDATFVIDNEGRVVAWNRAIERMSGVKAEEMLGKGNYEYAIPGFGERRPILIDLVRKWDNEIAKTYRYVKREDECLVSETYDSLVKPGLILWNKASLIYDAEGKVIGAIESIRDISDRKVAAEG